MKNIPNNIFYQQADLLISALPYVFKDTDFAMHGGTAINFFIRNMPRISVDIDLIYQKKLSREDTLKNISEELKRMADRIKSGLPGIKVEEKKDNNNLAMKLFVVKENAQIKVEPNIVFRGSVFGTQEIDISKKAEEVFEKFVVAKTLSMEDIYGSKICAALDRQHPRDLFDIKLLLENEGVSERVRKAFLVYLISTNRPISELLDPNMLDIKQLYENEFVGMADKDIMLDDLIDVRFELVKIVNSSISDKEKEFLITFKEGEPEWNLLGLEDIKELPSIKWKLLNIKKMKPSKHKEATAKLKRALKYK